MIKELFFQFAPLAFACFLALFFGANLAEAVTPLHVKLAAPVFGLAVGAYLAPHWWYCRWIGAACVALSTGLGLYLFWQ